VPWRIPPDRTDRPPNTVYAEMNEAIGGVKKDHRFDQSPKEGNERCHGACTAKHRDSRPTRRSGSIAPPP
jgi:hypothetical protein